MRISDLQAIGSHHLFQEAPRRRSYPRQTALPAVTEPLCMGTNMLGQCCLRQPRLCSRRASQDSQRSALSWSGEHWSASSALRAGRCSFGLDFRSSGVTPPLGRFRRPPLSRDIALFDSTWRFASALSDMDSAVRGPRTATRRSACRARIACHQGESATRAGDSTGFPMTPSPSGGADRHSEHHEWTLRRHHHPIEA